MSKPRLFYFYDALCGWCYGFSPVITRLHEEYANRLHIEAISGGMVRGARTGPIGQVAAFIKHAYKTVEDHTGVKFGEAFLQGILDEGTAVFSSLKPAYALCAFKSLRPEEGVPFSSALQKAIYYDGIKPDEWDSYSPIAESFGIDGKTFIALMQEDEMRERAEAEFTLCEKLGVTGFPTTVFEGKDGLYLLGRGYVGYEGLRSAIDDLLKDN